MHTSFFKTVSRELTVPCQYTELQKQSVKVNMEEKQMKRACLPRSLSLNRKLIVLCQYTEFQKLGVKINTEDKHRETCKFTTFFKREPQGKYEAKLKAHLHPRLIAVACFCFESLYFPKA